MNALWMIASWSRIGLRSRSRLPDVVVVGTDPIFSVMVSLPLKFLRRRLRIAHWCFDLHPEGAVSDGMLREDCLRVRLVKRILRRAYGCCDMIADLGDCMRRCLASYGGRHRRVTLTPWALAEPEAPLPDDPQARASLFGGAKLGLLYSGNYGRAHSCEPFLELARRLRGHDVGFAFAVRGNCVHELRRAVGPDDTNVCIVGFADQSEFVRRLGAASIHLASLRPNWAGVAVPSKFFGSLAVGRPVLFAGPRDCAIAKWIQQYRVGWVLDRGTLPAVADELRRLANEPHGLEEMQDRCFRLYHERFSYRRTMDRWDIELRDLLAADRSTGAVRDRRRDAKGATADAKALAPGEARIG